MTPYEILGIPVDATRQEIKAAYHAKAKEVHPDTSLTGDAGLDFIQLKRAYDVLYDPARRTRYDEDGTIDPDAPRIRDMAIANINFVFKDMVTKMISGIDPSHYDTIDILSNVKAAIELAISKTRSELHDVATLHERTRKALDVIKRQMRKDSGGDCIFTMVLEEQLASHKARLDPLNFNMAVFTEAKNIIDDYKYKPATRGATYVFDNSINNHKDKSRMSAKEFSEHYKCNPWGR